MMKRILRERCAVRSFITALFSTLILVGAATGYSSSQVKLGNQVLRASGYSELIGRKTAIFSNPSGCFPDTMVHIVDELNQKVYREMNIDVVAVLAPEHGFRGERQAEHGDPAKARDPPTGLWVYSIYNKTGSELVPIVNETGADLIVVDLQDAGVRLYTFIWTMFNLIQACGILEKEIMVLDRPNPLGGDIVEGPVLDLECCASGYGWAAIPHRHGMTYGELASFFVAEYFSSLQVKLKVIKLDGYKREMLWPDTGLPWIPPSPNLPTFQSNLAYPSTCFIEATNICEGRGTNMPFTMIGAPNISTIQLVNQLNNLTMFTNSLSPTITAPGQVLLSASSSSSSSSSSSPSSFFTSSSDVFFRAAWFAPTFFKYNFTDISGFQFFPSGVSSSRSLTKVSSFTMATTILSTFISMYPPVSSSSSTPNTDDQFYFKWDGNWFGHPGTCLVDWYAGTPLFRQMLDAGASVPEIVQHFQKEADTFKTVTRVPFLLYQ